MTLVEVLMGSAITAAVLTVVTSLLFTTAASVKHYRRLTEDYDGLRVVSSLLTQDTRFAYEASCTNADRVTLNYSNGDVIEYRFASYTPNGPTSDPGRLHRWSTIGGTFRDDVVAENLEMLRRVGGRPAGGTYFTCTTGAGGLWYVEAFLVKKAISTATPKVTLDVLAYQR